MIELIKVSANAEGKSVVSARELHTFLEVEDHFTQWAKRMFEYGFEENVDYQAVNEFVKHENGVGGTNKMDFALTLDCAKEIAMIQRSDKGKQARLYFIECEKKLQTLVKPLTITELIVKQALALDEQSKKLSVLEDRIEEVASQNIIKDENFYTITGYASLSKLKIDRTEGVKLGKMASSLSRASEYPIGKAFDEKYGQINTYHIDILKLTFKN